MEEDMNEGNNVEDNSENEVKAEEKAEAKQAVSETNNEEKPVKREVRHTSHKRHSAEKKEKHEEKAKELTFRIKKKTLKQAAMVLGIIVLLAVVVFGATKLIPAITGGGGGGAKSTVEFYVMSKCPYGIQVEDAIKPVLDKLGNSVDFSLNFIATDAGGGSFSSLHGDTEVQGDLVDLCAMKYEPKKYMDMIVCMNNDSATIPDSWEKCATAAKMNVASIKACYQGAEGKTLLSASIQKSTARQASGSPTMFINNQAYNGARDPTSFQRAVCANLAGNPNCAGIPPCTADSDCPAQTGKVAKCTGAGTSSAKCNYVNPVAVGLTIVNDKTCATTSCDATQLTTVLQQLFPGAKITNVDVNSADGKKLVSDFNLVYVPAYIFDSRLPQTEAWSGNTNLQGAFQKIGDSYKVTDSASGASYYISEQKRQETLAAKGIVLGDNKPQIDFFIMAYCPYGNQAEEAIEPVYQLLKDKAIFNPHYVIYANYGGGGTDYCMDNGNLCSMHGIQELHQDIRELCVDKYMGIKSWFAFALAMNTQCTAQNADTCWEAVAKGLGLDTVKITSCQSSEGLALLKNETSLDTLWGASGSPTLFIDGVEFTGSRTAEGFKTGLCAAFGTKPSECSTTLAGASTSATATPTTGGCG